MIDKFLKNRKKISILIVVGTFFYLLMYWDIVYSSNEDNLYFKDYITNNHFLIKKKFKYIYHIESLKKEENIELKKLSIRQIDLFGKEDTLYTTVQSEILTQENIFIDVSPFFTRKIIVLIVLDTKLGNTIITKEFYPFLEIGTYELWKFLFPILWETVQKVPLIKI